MNCDVNKRINDTRCHYIKKSEPVKLSGLWFLNLKKLLVWMICCLITSLTGFSFHPLKFSIFQQRTINIKKFLFLNEDNTARVRKDSSMKLGFHGYHIRPRLWDVTLWDLDVHALPSVKITGTFIPHVYKGKRSIVQPKPIK